MTYFSQRVVYMLSGFTRKSPSIRLAPPVVTAAVALLTVSGSILLIECKSCLLLYRFRGCATGNVGFL